MSFIVLYVTSSFIYHRPVIKSKFVFRQWTNEITILLLLYYICYDEGLTLEDDLVDKTKHS